MKTAFLILIISYSTFTLGVPCNGAPGKYYVNPDGSNGGFVQKGAWVEKSNFISSDSEICDKVIIKGRNLILDRSLIQENVIIEGASSIRDSRIYGYAKIKGLTSIQNSEICQASLIEGIKVINSKYYCQTEDSRPVDPGIAGDKTLIGIDSDGDGVRDDVENYINDAISNTSALDNSISRINTKFFAKIVQKEILLRHSSSSLKGLVKLEFEFLRCYEIELSKDVMAKIYNTYTRIRALAEISRNTHGMEVQNQFEKCKSLNEFSKELSNY